MYCYRTLLIQIKNNDNVGNIGIDISTSIHVIIKIQFKLYKFSLKYTLQYILVGLNQNCLSCVIITSLFCVLCNYITRYSFYIQIINDLYLRVLINLIIYIKANEATKRFIFISN